LQKKIDLTTPKNDPETEAEVTSTILDLLYKAKNPILLTDACSARHGVVDEVHELLGKLQIPGFVTPMGKGVINETDPQYGGVYIGRVSLPEVKKAVEGSDCILSIGSLLSDFNTVLSRLNFSSHLRDRSAIISTKGVQSSSIPRGQRYSREGRV
jgi:pyruvate decarboxylase